MHQGYRIPLNFNAIALPVTASMFQGLGVRKVGLKELFRGQDQVLKLLICLNSTLNEIHCLIAVGKTNMTDNAIPSPMDRQRAEAPVLVLGAGSLV